MIRTFETHKIRYQKELSESIWKFTPCEGKYSNVAFDAVVPGCWENMPEFGAYRGEGIYSRKIEIGGNIRFEFKGVSHTATVYLDGNKIASHYNAYTIFDTVIPNLDYGTHHLEVRVDNRFSTDSALHVPNDYMTYGGIIRPVVLEVLPNIYIESMGLTPKKVGDEWRLKVDVRLKNIGIDNVKSYELVLQGMEQEVKVDEIEIEAGQSIEVGTEFICPKVQLWDFNSPTLYEITALLNYDGGVIDDFIDRVGFREVKVEGKQILLNGKPIRIKGFCRHEDHPQFGCALSFSAIQADIMLIRDLGANSIRTTHYPNNEIFLDLCDEQGILVWEENHARGLSLEQMENPKFEIQAECCIKEMINAHYNHPCIYIWGILNECASDTMYGRQCYKKQYELIKELDPTRLRSSASCKFKTDICLDIPEVISYNIYPEWYVDINASEYLEDLYAWVQEDLGNSEKPFLITETGAGAIYGNRSSYLAKWSEEYQSKALQDQIRAVFKHPGCSGVYIWQFCDNRISSEYFLNRPRTMNNKGVVDEFRRRKLSYYIVKSLFQACGNYIET